MVSNKIRDESCRLPSQGPSTRRDRAEEGIGGLSVQDIVRRKYLFGICRLGQEQAVLLASDAHSEEIPTRSEIGYDNDCR